MNTSTSYTSLTKQLQFYRHTDGSARKESACNAGDTGDAGTIPGEGRYPGRKCQPTSVFLLKDPMDREIWWATFQRVATEYIGLTD